DSNVSVRGNIVIYENVESKNKKTLLIFGDSFSIDIANFLSHSFSRVVRVFSGADLDWGSIEFEKPDHVLIELTSRFLVRAPNLNFSIIEEMKAKYNALTTDSLDAHIKKLEDGRSPANEYYICACLNAAKQIRVKR